MIIKELYWLDKGSTLDNMGVLYFKLGDIVQSDKNLKDSALCFRNLSEQSLIQHASSFALVLEHQGMLDGHMRRYPEALKALAESLKIRQKIAASSEMLYSPGVASALHNLGTLHLSMGQHEQAIIVLSKSLDQRSELLKVSPDQYFSSFSKTLNNIKLAYINSQRFDKVEEVLKDVLRKYLQTPDESSKLRPQFINQAYIELVGFYIEMNREAEWKDTCNAARLFHKKSVLGNSFRIDSVCP